MVETVRELKKEIEALKKELELTKIDSEECKDVNQDMLKALKDFRSTVEAIHVIVDLHTRKHPGEREKQVAVLREQFDPLLAAASSVREWFVENWPEILRLVAMCDDAGLDEALKEQGIAVVDPGGRLVQLDKALRLARGGDTMVRGWGSDG